MMSQIHIKSKSLKSKNEDFIATAINITLDIKAIILGDGIGSHYKPDEGAEFCVNSLKKQIENCKTLSDLNFKELFQKVYAELKEAFDKNNEENIDKTKAYGTTLICALELNDKYIIAYLGNGSAWHIRGNFSNFSTQRYFPWNAINLLNPHTVEEDGKEALYKFIALESTENQILPSIIEFSKDNILFGDMVIISTDGLYSNDQIPVAKDREGNLWIAGEKKMEILFNRLKDLIKASQFEEEKIRESLNEYLNDITEKKLIDDDITFGIIVNIIIENEKKE
jgi:serine/threonine protein phosphatase PrpC